MFQEIRSKLRLKTRRIFNRPDVDNSSVFFDRGSELKKEVEQNKKSIERSRMNSWSSRSRYEAELKCVSKLGEIYQPPSASIIGTASVTSKLGEVYQSPSPSMIGRTSVTDDYKASVRSVLRRQTFHSSNTIPLSHQEFKEFVEKKRRRLTISFSLRRKNSETGEKVAQSDPSQMNDGTRVSPNKNLSSIDENCTVSGALPDQVDKSIPHSNGNTLHDTGKESTNRSTYTCPHCSHILRTNSVDADKNVTNEISTNRSKNVSADRLSVDTNLSSYEVIARTTRGNSNSIGRNHTIPRPQKPRAVVFRNNSRLSRISQSLKQLVFRSKRRQIEADAKSLNSFSNHSGHSRKSSDTSQISLVSGEPIFHFFSSLTYERYLQAFI